MKHTDTPIRAFKVTDENMQCRGFQFELGKDYQSDNPVRCGSSGFHSCLMAADCFRYYDFMPTNRVFEVEFWGDYEDSTDDSKISSQYIRLIRELTWHEVLDLVNIGKSNTGIGNSGDRNSGNRNSGNGNSGDGNSGDGNSGDGNSGNGNSGDGNSGDGNSGSFNSCNYSSGFFNTQEQDVWMFNRTTGKKLSEIVTPYIPIQLTELVSYTDTEIAADPSKALAGGYFKTYTYKEAWANWLKTATKSQIDEIRELPNFDSEVFFEITGLII